MNPYLEPEAPTTLGSNRGRGTGGNAGAPGTRSGREIETEEQMPSHFKDGDQVHWKNTSLNYEPLWREGDGEIVRTLTDQEEYDRKSVGFMYEIRLPDGNLVHVFHDELTLKQETGRDGARRGSTARGGGK